MAVAPLSDVLLGRGASRSVRPGRRPRLQLLALGAVASLGLGLLIAAPAEAATTLTVSTTADVPTNTGACGNPGITTPPSPLSLREAVCLANNIGGAVRIDLPAGIYHLTNGELQLGKTPGQDVTLAGAGAASTVIDAGGLSRVLDLDPSILGGVAVSISGLTVSGGRVTTFGGAGIIAGSGTAATSDTLTISNSVITGNQVNSATTNKPGGGLQFIGGSLTITNTTFSNNSSGSSPGSGVHYSARGTAPGEQLTVSGTTFRGNTANASAAGINIGGALSTQIQAGSPATFTVSDSKFIDNTVVGSGTGIPQGAGIFSQSGSLSLTRSTFTGNSASGGSNPSGGAISILGGTATAHYNRFTGNQATNGGGVFLGASATLDATDNWWGCNAGPGSAGCDEVSGTPTVSPRLVLTATASPGTVVGPDATSTITAALTQNSLGAPISGAQLGAFTGLPVSWSDPLPTGASVSPSSSNLGSGVATTTYDSQGTRGPGHVLASLDNATATAPITVNRAPAITSADTATYTVGTPGSFTVSTTGYPDPALTLVGTLPSGLTFTDLGDGTATLSGTPDPGTGGSYPVTLTADNGVSPNGTQSLTVNVDAAPAFTSADQTTFLAGHAGSFTVTTSGSPAPALTETGALPAGVTFLDNGDGTATLSGTPTEGGSFPITLGASNGVSPDAAQSFTLDVATAPARPAVTDSSPGPGSVLVTLSPGDDGGSPITEYDALCVGTDGARNRLVSSAGTAIRVTGLAGDRSYHCRVRAKNAVGASVWSRYGQVVQTGVTVPRPPVVADTTPGAGQITVAFTPRGDGGSPVTDFRTVCVSTDGGVNHGRNGAASPLTVTRLDPGHSYHCRVRATNAFGTGPWGPYGTIVVVG